MKILRQSRLNRYYDLCLKNNTSLERQIARLTHDPIRYCDGENERVALRPIKAVRLG
jgi:hypothetical protein